MNKPWFPRDPFDWIDGVGLWEKQMTEGWLDIKPERGD